MSSKLSDMQCLASVLIHRAEEDEQFAALSTDDKVTVLRMAADSVQAYANTQLGFEAMRRFYRDHLDPVK